MPFTEAFQCPLCRSKIGKAVYERVLKLDEARKAEIARRDAEYQKRLRDLDRRRDALVKNAVEAERRRAEKERRAQLERLRRAADRERQKLMSEIARMRRSAEAASARASQEAEKRAAEATRLVEAKHASEMAALRADLKLERARRERDGQNWKKQIEELRARADAPDRDHLGPEGEAQLVEMLRAAYPSDRIVHRGKGGDVLHTVMEDGRPCGIIVYECKRTATWNAQYARQLKKAMDQHRTKYGLLVSRTLPRNTSGICVVKGALVACPGAARPLSAVLRDAIVCLSRTRMPEGQKAAKTAALFEYLRSDEFANAFTRIEDHVAELRDIVARERTSHDRWWRGREEHYSAVLRHVGGIGSRIREIVGAPRPQRPRAVAVLHQGDGLGDERWARTMH